MLRHEARLIDPTPEEAAGALSAAAVLANADHPDRRVADDPAEWRKFARRMGKQPEGWQVWRGGPAEYHQSTTSFVLAGWWTDPPGRKHLAARSWRVTRYYEELFRKPDLDRRPPLWHVYPEFCCLRHDRDGTHLVCACGCGAVGTPATLGWVGDRCGPCSDHSQDGGLLPAGVPGVLRRSDPVSDADTVSWVAEAAALGAVRWAGAGEVRLADPGLALSVQTVAWEHYLRLNRRPSGEVVRSLQLPRTFGNGAPFAVSPDETLVAAVTGQAVLVDLRTWAVIGSVPAPPGGEWGGVGFAPDGSRLFLAGGLDVWAYDTAGWKRAASGSVRGAFGQGHRKDEWVRRLAIDPAGEAVYLAGGGPVYALDPATLALRATLDWHLGAVTDLAVSADGERLFTAGADGCVRVWPVRRLLEGA
jgi:WD40 repeat protein